MFHNAIIILLRTQGASITEISIRLNIPKTTVFRYAQGVVVPADKLILLTAKRGGSRLRKIKAERLALEEERKTVRTLSTKEKLLFASALYWAEGNKKDLILTNPDPDLIKVFINIAKQVLGVKEQNIQISIRLYEDLDIDSCLLFWSSITGIPKENFLSVHILPGKKTGKLKHGMCRVRIKKGGYILKKIMGINKAIVSQF